MEHDGREFKSVFGGGERGVGVGGREGREGREGRGGGGGMCTRQGNTYKLINFATPGSFINIV